MTIHRRLIVTATALALSTLALAGCAGTAAAPDDGAVSVVASTNVYGQIAEAIGGDAVEVTSIVHSGAQDPHSFEPSARDQLTVSRADLIVENGGGYDPFVDALIEASGSDATVLTAVEFSSQWTGGAAHDDSDADHGGEDGHDHVEGFNEHVWYDPAAMSDLAAGIASALEVLSPDDSATFEANLEEFRAGLSTLGGSLSAVESAHAGTGIFATEPVPLYLTEAAGLVNLAPEAFTEAVEEGQDVPPATLIEALDLLESGEVRVVVANAQTGGAETSQVIDEADAQAIPVVEFTETLPDGETYLSWMESNVAALSRALST